MSSSTIKTEFNGYKCGFGMCRLCLSEESLEDVFEQDELSQWISNFLSITISVEDNFSQTICSICRLRLMEFNQFRLRCLEVQGVLQSMIEQKNVTFGIIESQTALQETKSEPCSIKNEYTLHEASANSGETFDNDDMEDIIEAGAIKIEPREDDDLVVENNPAMEKIDPNERQTACDMKNQHQCDVCHKTFSTKKKLSCHKRTHRAKKLVCTVCEKPFAWRWKLQTHMITHEAKLTTDGNIARPYKCDICQRGFRNRESKRVHYTQVHGPKNHECHICGLRFQKQSALAFHIKHHITRGETKEEYLLLNELRRNKTGKICDNGIEDEQQTEGESSNHIYNDEFASTGTDEKKRLECVKCHKMYQTMRGLWHHFKLAHQRKFDCTMCKGAFPTQKLLDIHVLKIHQPKDGEHQSLECRPCNKNFPSIPQLNRHMRIHQPKTFSCEVCNRLFRREYDLKSHMKTHLKDENRPHDLGSCLS